MEKEDKRHKRDGEKYEKKIIRKLQVEREFIQQKTFTKWVNSILIKAKMEVNNIFTDLSDGRKLLILLELISGESIGKPNNGTLRVHKLENVRQSLAFVNSKVRLVSIGPEDIVDGNKRLILGLIWTIILRFQIDAIKSKDFNTLDLKSAKEALLLWCQTKTTRYSSVRVKDFTQSWRSGMAFNALIHAHKPDLIDYSGLDPEEHISNLNNAFDVASNKLGVPRLLDAEDIDIDKPDEKSIITYLSCFYQTLTKLEKDLKYNKRIANIVTQLIEVEKLQLKYGYLAKSLLNWIETKIKQFNDRHLPNSLEAIQREFTKFKEYINVEKPSKFIERNECEAIHFEIETTTKASGYSLYSAPEGCTVNDVEKAWNELEREESKRQDILRGEFLRLEKLENLASSFRRKCVLRETYINDKLKLLGQSIYNSDKTINFEKTATKLKVIGADIAAQSDKFENLSVVARELINGNYCHKEHIELSEQNIITKWKQLLDELEKNQNIFSGAADLLGALKEAEVIRNEMKEAEKSLILLNITSIDIQLVVEELQRLYIIEMQIVSMGEIIRKLNSILNTVSLNNSKQEIFTIIQNEAPLLSSSLEKLNSEYVAITDLAKYKKQKLEQIEAYHQFIQDIEEEEVTICERQRICQSIISNKDLSGVISLQHEHSLLETDIKGRESRITKLIDCGQQFISGNHPESSDIASRIENLEHQWKSLQDLTQQLSNAIEALQYHLDADEIEIWMKDKIQLLKSEEYGRDESSALALLQRHSRLEGEIQAFDNDIKRLDVQSERILRSDISQLFVTEDDTFTCATAIDRDYINQDCNGFNEKSAEDEDEKLINKYSENRSNRKRKLSITYNAECVEKRQRNINSSYSQLLSLCNIKRQKLKDSIQLLNYNSEFDAFELQIEKIKQSINDTNIGCSNDSIKDQSNGLLKDLRIELIANQLKLDEINRITELCTYGRDDDFSSEILRRQIKIKSDWNQINLLVDELQNQLTTDENLDSASNQMKTDVCHDIDEENRETCFENSQNGDTNSHLECKEEFIEEESIENNDKKLENESTNESKSQLDLKDSDDQNDMKEENIEINEKEKEMKNFKKEELKQNFITDSFEKSLEFEQLGTTVDETKALIRRHDDLMATLLAEDQRLDQFNDMVEELVDTTHNDSSMIDAKRKKVIERRTSVKQKALLRKQLLSHALVYQEFKADTEEFLSWCKDKKKKIAKHKSYKDLTNLETKLQKHEAFEAEISENRSQLATIIQKGKQMISNSHFARDKVEQILKSIDSQWIELCSLTETKGKCLGQANSQLIYNKRVERTEQQIEKFNKCLTLHQFGTDLKSSKGLIKKHQALESEVLIWEKEIEEIMKIGQQMAEDHFDREKILNVCQVVGNSFDKVKTLLEERKASLLESLEYHELEFEINAELQWIREHIPSVSSEIIGKNLADAQSFLKKFEQYLELEIKGHESQINKVLEKGKNLISQKHFATKDVENKCKELSDNWKILSELVLNRKKSLEISLKVEQLLSEANEVESWMNEKFDILNSSDYGKDDNETAKLLTKQEAIELEIDTYSGLIIQMNHQSKKLIDMTNESDDKIITSRMQDIHQQMDNLQKLAYQRRLKLMESKNSHEFLRESDEFLRWISDQMQTASSEDIGEDYEHLLTIQSKFFDFKRRVSNNEERYKQFKESAQRLCETEINENTEKRLLQLEESWNSLLDKMEAREQKLTAAEKIHRFNGDFAQILSIIQEKFSVINSDDLGQDLNSVESLIKKHEVIENDLVALGTQLQVLIDDSTRLQVDQNAEHVLEQHDIVVQHWTALQEKALIRKEKLQQSHQLQRFIDSVRDLERWAIGLTQEIQTHEKARDAQSAQLTEVEHQRIKAEIETRENIFNSVVQTGQLMIEQNHYATEQIKLLLNKLLQTRQKWQLNKVYLDQLIDLQFFLRDCKQLELLSSQQKHRLKHHDFGRTLEEVNANSKVQEAFEKLVNSYDEKLLALKESGTKLIKQNHFDSELIKSKLDEITVKLSEVKQICSNRRQRLADALILAQFRRDVNETQNWIDSKAKQLEVEKNNKVNNIKKLQMHQAFQEELSANTSNIESIEQKGDHLISKFEDSSRIRSQLEHLLKKWNQLLNVSIERGRELGETQDALDFNNNVEEVESWIRVKELMIQLKDTGEDFERCLSLRRKLDDVDSDMRVNETRIQQINQLADKLLRQKSQNKGNHQRRCDDLNEKWKNLQLEMDVYRNRLDDTLVEHSYKKYNYLLVPMLTSEEQDIEHLPSSKTSKQQSLLRDETGFIEVINCEQIDQLNTSPIESKSELQNSNKTTIEEPNSDQNVKINQGISYSQTDYTSNLSDENDFNSNDDDDFNETNIEEKVYKCIRTSKLNETTKSDLDGTQKFEKFSEVSEVWIDESKVTSDSNDISLRINYERMNSYSLKEENYCNFVSQSNISLKNNENSEHSDSAVTLNEQNISFTRNELLNPQIFKPKNFLFDGKDNEIKRTNSILENNNVTIENNNDKQFLNNVGNSRESLENRDSKEEMGRSDREWVDEGLYNADLFDNVSDTDTESDDEDSAQLKDIKATIGSILENKDLENDNKDLLSVRLNQFLELMNELKSLNESCDGSKYKLSKRLNKLTFICRTEIERLENKLLKFRNESTKELNKSQVEVLNYRSDKNLYGCVCRAFKTSLPLQTTIILLLGAALFYSYSRRR